MISEKNLNNYITQNLKKLTTRKDEIDSLSEKFNTAIDDKNIELAKLIADELAYKRNQHEKLREILLFAKLCIEAESEQDLKSVDEENK